MDRLARCLDADSALAVLRARFVGLAPGRRRLSHGAASEHGVGEEVELVQSRDAGMEQHRIEAQVTVGADGGYGVLYRGQQVGNVKRGMLRGEAVVAAQGLLPAPMISSSPNAKFTLVVSRGVPERPASRHPVRTRSANAPRPGAGQGTLTPLAERQVTREGVTRAFCCDGGDTDSPGAGAGSGAGGPAVTALLPLGARLMSAVATESATAIFQLRRRGTAVYGRVTDDGLTAAAEVFSAASGQI